MRHEVGVGSVAIGAELAGHRCEAVDARLGAVNVLRLSRKPRAALLEGGVRSGVVGITAKYEHRVSLSDWASLGVRGRTKAGIRRLRRKIRTQRARRMRVTSVGWERTASRRFERQKNERVVVGGQREEHGNSVSYTRFRAPFRALQGHQRGHETREDPLIPALRWLALVDTRSSTVSLLRPGESGRSHRRASFPRPIEGDFFCRRTSGLRVFALPFPLRRESTARVGRRGRCCAAEIRRWLAERHILSRALLRQPRHRVPD